MDAAGNKTKYVGGAGAARVSLFYIPIRMLGRGSAAAADAQRTARAAVAFRPPEAEKRAGPPETHQEK